MGATVTAVGFTKRYLEVLKSRRHFDDTVTAAISDGKLELHEVDAMLSILRGDQVEAGKFINQLQRLRVVLMARDTAKENTAAREAIKEQRQRMPAMVMDEVSVFVLDEGPRSKSDVILQSLLRHLNGVKD